MNIMNPIRCSICDCPVDPENLHPDSLEWDANDEKCIVVHIRCANGEDANDETAADNVDLTDERAWIIFHV